MKHKFLASLLALALSLSLAAVPASALDLEDAKDLLQQYYVDEIPEEILALDSLDEILAALGDPYTVYMTAEEYESFLTSVNGNTVVGIGVSIQNAFESGYQIMSILPDSPAEEAGLEAGDRIIAVDGVALTESSNIRALISGEEGTPVTITVVSRSDGQQRDYALTRRSVVIPIVTYDKEGNAGVIRCISFGSSTTSTIEEALESLDADVSVWVMDLRSNPGGTSNAAAGSAGLFVGSEVMVYFRNGDGQYNYVYTTSSCPDLTDKPLLVLTSPYSASGSELFAAAARDHGFGIGIGQRTFGKGIAQLVLCQDNTSGSFDGDALKVTAYRFFSPDGATNHIVGVIPTLLVSSEHTRAVADLLSAPSPAQPDHYMKLELAGQTLYVDLNEALRVENRAAFQELLQAIPPAAQVYHGEGGLWKKTTVTSLASKLKLHLTLRGFRDSASSPFAREIDTLAVYQILSGYEDNTFRPKNTITRAEFCSMVATAMDLPANQKALTFSDTPADAWYADAVSAMASRGFISGYNDGTFRPDDTITYEEMVTILSSVAAWASMDGEALVQEGVPASQWGQYSDYSDWAQTPARTLDNLGALVGNLAPSDNGTREVAAGMLCSLMEHIHLLWY